MVLGMQDGSIRLQPLETPGDIGTMGDYWRNTMHDNNYGQITGLGISYSDQYLFTVGADGNVFSYLLMDEEKLMEYINEAKLLKRAEIPPVLVGCRHSGWSDVELLGWSHQ